MKRRITVLLAACIIISTIGTVVRCEDAPEESKMDKRRKFIADFDHMILDTAAEDAMLLRILVSAAELKRGIEVGTCRAFGAINIGIAFERNGGHLDTVDINHDRVVTARGNLKQLALDDTVTVIEGDALEVLPKLTGKYDFAFLDALKRDYFKYFKSIEARLTPGSIIAADNTISYASAMRDFLKYIKTDPHYETIIVRSSMAKDDGMSLTYKIADENEKVDASATEAREKIIAAQPKGALTLDTMLLRILVDASSAKRALQIGSGGAASLDMGIALERTGGKLVAVELDSKLSARATADIKAADLDQTITLGKGTASDLIAAEQGKFDFVLLAGDRTAYLKKFKALEKKLAPGTIVVADKVLENPADVKGFLEYVADSKVYEFVTLRPEDKKQTDGVIVIHKFPTDK